MLLTLAATAFLMGLAGGVHCAAMCGAPCAGVSRFPAAGAAAWRRMACFQAGRAVGYAALGALAATAVQGLAWVSAQTGALRPLWTLMHVAVLAWGLLLVLRARQPAWVDQAGQRLWRRLQPWIQAPGGIFATGALWALMPCGLLYSALLVASLGGDAVGGAVAMALFAAGSGLWLCAGPWLWTRLRSRLDGMRRDWGTRAGGAVLCGMAAWSLWADVVHRTPLWCL
ncbi:sulfite exporter TauE/SafE family protein [Ramlibacter sp. H39-3-26]|uniref:sulfite exporter TauE/SafE family protein n=1 Tax=Curvibacter soli TaxID=3031331 RepID=UPI0023DB23E8|nr:sulfite exporter TauE/SafE family protein [Ramlibacter sp. H39-3-26]MDF1485337.1 sulfite exporter TauE/SafE family protein [Ramlibacter sp. H39-3-26]